MRIGGSFLARSAFAAFALFLLAGAWPALAQTPQIGIDSNLAENQEVAGTIRVIGFAITPSSSGYVEIAVDNQNLGRAAYPLQRTDVPNSGFIMEIDTLNFPNGAHAIKASSFTAAGEAVAATTRNLRFANVFAKGAFEAPAPRTVVTGTVAFTGWALGDGGFKRLEVLIDGRFTGLANWGGPRSDIAAQYPEYGIANSGFSASIDLDVLGLAHGIHRVVLVGVDGKDTRRWVAVSEFSYGGGRAGRNALEVPAQAALVSSVGSIRVAGWTEGANPAAKVDVYINDRWVGSSTDVVRPRPDVVATASPGATNIGGFDFTVPGYEIGRGPQRIVAVVTDTQGQKANVDFTTGPVTFYVSNSERLFGAHLRPAVDYAASIAQYTADAGVGPDIVMYFQPWRTSTGACATFNEFPFLPNKVIAANAKLMVSWEPLQDGAGSTQPAFTYAQILAGAQDACITAYAQQVKDFGQPVLLRMAHEMNGQSNNWTGIANGNDPQGYVAMYRKVVDMFRAAGALNAKFVWSPDHATPPEVPAPSSEIRNYYPGDGYVDFIGVSGYNWGNDPLRGGGWVTAAQLFGNFLDQVDRDFPGKPILITEIGSVPSYDGNVRSDWYNDTFAFLGARKEVKGIVWFNDYAFALTTFPDFRIANTPGLPAVNAAEIAVVKSLIAAYRATRDLGTYAVVFEFYAPSLDHYFRTAAAEEAASLRNNPNLGWQYTGNDFKAYLHADYPAGALQVCRFYGSLTIGPNSHFYTADPGECAFLRQLQAQTPNGVPRWNFEEYSFSIDVPANGRCPASAPIAVWRAYNKRAAQNDSNHRYTTDIGVYQEMIRKGWSGEGIVMCASV